MSQAPERQEIEWQEIHRCSRCRVWARRAGPAVETLAVGRLDASAAAAMTQKFDEAILRSGHCIAFHDWWESPNYDTPYRTGWEKWLKQQSSGAIHGVHVLTPSGVMRMGLALANLVYSQVTFRAYKDRAVYESLLHKHLPARATTPSLTL